MPTRGSLATRAETRQALAVRTTLLSLFALALAASCGGAQEPPVTAPPPSEPVAAPEPAPDVVTLSIVGTNDLHGHIESLPTLAGYLRNLRAARAADGGAVLLADGGDMFQGTLESNTNEGAIVVQAYGALGYDAATVGNHEFDFGPVGPAATPRAPGDDPRGALRARIGEARFPILTANIVDAQDTPWDAAHPDVIVEKAGVSVGILGISTNETARTTIAANFAGLHTAPLAETIAARAASLRERGARVVVVAAHAGGVCEPAHADQGTAGCEEDQEIFEVARALPPGIVDVIVAGHTHQGVARVVAGVAIIESFANGNAFGRVDLRFDRRAGRVEAVQVLPPQRLCPDVRRFAADCALPTYEGARVARDPEIEALLAPAFEAARARREEPLGVTLEAAFRRGDRESALGNLLADRMREALPGADVALLNGGGIRADLPAGPLTYGALFETFPFDNRYARMRIRAADFARVVERNARRDGSVISIGGVRAEVRCEGSEVRVQIFRGNARRPLRDDDELVLVTSDFVATGGDSLLADLAERGGLEILDDPPIRDAIADVLRRGGGTLRPEAFLDPRHPRIALPSERPVTCP